MAKKTKKTKKKQGQAAKTRTKTKTDTKAKPRDKAGKAKKKAAGKAKSPKKPRPVKTGKGASPAELGERFVSLFQQGKIEEIESRLWSDKIVSVEGLGVSLAWHGRAAADFKNREWAESHKIHGAQIEGPFVGATGFSVKFSVDVENTVEGTRATMDEVGVYTVKRGKIVREEFMYGG